MSDNKDLLKDIPDPNTTFLIDTNGAVTNKRFVGEFVSKVPNLKDQGMIAKHEAYLNGEFAAHLDPSIKELHKMLAYLRYTITESPKFWKDSDLGYELRDVNVIKEVYNTVAVSEEKWLAKIWTKADPDEKA